MRLSEQPLLTADQIRTRVCELGREISKDYKDRQLTAVTVMNGGVIFVADILREITVPTMVDFVRARSYKGNHSTGAVTVTVLPETPLAGKHVLVVEDILDTGRTARVIIDRLQAEEPATLKVCALLNKPARRVVPVPIDYCGFTVDDHFVVGYGLDYNEQYRDLPAIYTIEND